ncbi:hypothetical protein PX554_03610 [Sphingomonas sp. H39-1-10]|uniref:hypothetical protein n=1 Tax=Sphingomonas pollutisoli TaxID=3030829 RepID=UPI0023B8B1AE|nr:hypothetical protein [Sphingomonas pollutisoli]MDF0487206.1 hypothetical protein [Sphingomonas pollutisoli]
MHDDFHGPEWADQHRRVSDMIHKLFTATMAAFQRLNEDQFAAPWRREVKRKECR